MTLRAGILKSPLALTLLLLLAAVSLRAETKPNIVMIYIDDWAWNGSSVPMDDAMRNSFMPLLEMPNVEKLARQGTKFTHAYGAHQCAPARASVQTGQSGPRSGYTLVLGKTTGDYYDERKDYQHFPLVPTISESSLDADAVTIPDALKPLGYASAHVGKWHLYSDPGDAGYVLHDGDTNNNPGNTIDKERRMPADMVDPKLMFSMTDKAIGFMEQQVKQATPFYLQISHYAMHEGPECLPQTREKYAKHPQVQAYYEREGKAADTVARKQDPAVWLGMGEDLDGRIGAVLDKIEALGIAENTYVVMVADNGYRHHALHVIPGMTQPHHGHKWWAWQGGIRVPMIVKGPGIKAGAVFDGNVVNYDFLPTFVDWAGGDPGALQNIDGVSLAAYMRGEQPDDTFLNRYLYFHVPHYRQEVPHSAIVSGDMKVMHFYASPDIPMLFNLSDDPGEVSNIARQIPQVHERLYAEMMRYFKQVGARIPKANPNYDPAEYQKHKDYPEHIMWGPFEGDRPLEEDEI